MTNDQKKGIKSILNGIAVIAIIIGAITSVYDVLVGVIIALVIWIVGFPILRTVGLHPEEEESSEAGENKSATEKKKSSFWRIAVSVIGVLIILLFASSYAFGRGSGNLISENREISNFNQVQISGTGVLNIVQSGEESLEVEAEDNVMEYIETVVENNTLMLRLKNPWFFWTIWPTRKITYNLTVDDLKHVGISGSGEINSISLEADDFAIQISGSGKADMVLDVENLDINISGSGEFLLSGEATDQDIIISGSGDYNAKNLVSKTASIKVSGSGEGVLNASEELDITISGSGEVQYIGSPNLSQSISGSGKIKQYSGTVESTEANNNTNTKVTEMPEEGEYDCMASVNCMPIIPKERSWICSSDYINWATENCADFQVLR
ncbi:DUF2807 domain-containing protein [Patescibacteria group bacterium]|nr:DUF2807 domain-containing protein [Patescibacteria group bacterium]